MSTPASSDHRLKLCLKRCGVILFRCLTFPGLLCWSPAISATVSKSLWICLVDIWPISRPSKTYPSSRPFKWSCRASRTGFGRMEVRCFPPLPFTMCRYPPGPSRCSTFKAATSETRRPQPAINHRRAASRGLGAAASSLCHSSRVRNSSGCMSIVLDVMIY